MASIGRARAQTRRPERASPPEAVATALGPPSIGARLGRRDGLSVLGLTLDAVVSPRLARPVICCWCVAWAYVINASRPLSRSLLSAIAKSKPLWQPRGITKSKPVLQSSRLHESLKQSLKRVA
eukprot:scaffold55982_cov54-Phaeocystis_antarctica.AAC.3